MPPNEEDYEYHTVAQEEVEDIKYKLVQFDEVIFLQTIPATVH